MDRVTKTEAQWQQELSPEAYQITRQCSTERPFSGKYWDLHDQGIYHCVCCGTSLFDSDAKFNSGTGWPSFWQPVANEHIEEVKDSSHGMIRTEIRCRRCGAHLGHVFEDGPKPTGMRYCLNSAALDFKPRS